jgi:hypothetical protein
MRVRADMAHVTDASTYECFTCLAPGSRPDKNASVERDAAGKPIYAWKANTAAPGFDLRKQLVEAGKMKADESPLLLRDIETDTPIQSHGGSVFWNAFRKRWVMISGQAFGGPSYLGELWFAEADTPVGPWVYARKIITHTKYTFYNPTQHPFFDQDGGRQIYFEGTYTNTYSGTEDKDKTPLYDYNQVMYCLTLDDARLSLPAPVYKLKDGTLAMREEVAARNAWVQIESIPFFALPPSRAAQNNVAIKSGATTLFSALSPQAANGEKPSPGVIPLYESGVDGQKIYSTQDAAGAKIVGRVWRNPSSVVALDFETRAL